MTKSFLFQKKSIIFVYQINHTYDTKRKTLFRR